MIRSFTKSIGAAIALLAAPAVNAQTDDMLPDVGVDAVAGMMAGAFEAEPLTPEQEERLPQAKGVVATMLPEGFYVEMMEDMISNMISPMMDSISGEMGAEIMLATRLDMDREAFEALTGEERIEAAKLLDPGFAERGAVMSGFLSEVMGKAAIVIEPVFREGLSKAYAARFTASELDDLAAFFETPTGAVFATENMRLMSDPQVMSASMQAVPAMLGQFSDMGAAIDAKMAELPAERSLGELTDEERARLAELLGVESAQLDAVVTAPKTNAYEDSGVVEEAVAD